MRSLDSACSIRSARIASRALRASVRSAPTSMFFATCWVMVEAPPMRRPEPYCSRLVTTARMMPMGSTPRCSRKRWSSAETKACATRGGMASIGTNTRRSAASSAISRLSAA